MELNRTSGIAMENVHGMLLVEDESVWSDFHPNLFFLPKEMIFYFGFKGSIIALQIFYAFIFWWKRKKRSSKLLLRWLAVCSLDYYLSFLYSRQFSTLSVLNYEPLIPFLRNNKYYFVFSLLLCKVLFVIFHS